MQSVIFEIAATNFPVILTLRYWILLVELFPQNISGISHGMSNVSKILAI